MVLSNIACFSGGTVFLSENDNTRSRGIQRYQVTSPRTYSLDVFSFSRPERTEHTIRIVDFSVVGVGIEVLEPIERGLVHFREPVGGHKFGVLVWSKHCGDRHQAGIKFVVLPAEDETYLLERVKEPLPAAALQTSDKIMTALLEFIQKETIG
jgi:hypothetical protein